MGEPLDKHSPDLGFGHYPIVGGSGGAEFSGDGITLAVTYDARDVVGVASFDPRQEPLRCHFGALIRYGGCGSDALTHVVVTMVRSAPGRSEAAAPAHQPLRLPLIREGVSP